MIIIPDIKDYKEIYPFRNGKGFSPQTRLIAFCMKLSGIEKLYPFDNVHEFLVRLPLAFKKTVVIELFLSGEHLLEFDYHGITIKTYANAIAEQIGMFPSETRFIDVINNYESKGYLIDFEYEGMQMTLTADDISRHIGMHFTKFPKEPFHRDIWSAGINESLTDMRFDNDFTDEMPLYLDPMVNLRKKKYEDDIIIEPETGNPTELNPEFVNSVLIFADKVMSSIPEHLFEEFRMNNLPFVVNSERYKNAQNRPVLSFDWDSFPADVKDEVIKNLFPEIYHEGITLEETEKEHFLSAEGLIYLAWLYANDFVWDGGKDMIIDPGYDFGLWLVDEDQNDGCSNSEITADWYFKEFKMGNVLGLLKGITGKGETRLRTRGDYGELMNDSESIDDNSGSGSGFKENGDEDELTDLPF